MTTRTQRENGLDSSANGLTSLGSKRPLEVQLMDLLEGMSGLEVVPVAPGSVLRLSDPWTTALLPC